MPSKLADGQWPQTNKGFFKYLGSHLKILPSAARPVEQLQQLLHSLASLAGQGNLRVFPKTSFFVIGE